MAPADIVLHFGVIAGLALFSKGSFYRTLAGQVAQGLLAIACFALIITAFVRYGWKIGLLDALVAA